MIVSVTVRANAFVADGAGECKCRRAVRAGGLRAVVAASSLAWGMLSLTPRCVRDARPEGRDGGGRQFARSRLGAVRHGGIVPYRARSPARSAQSYRARRDTPRTAVRSPKS